jgi:hypothetical protein
MGCAPQFTAIEGELNRVANPDTPLRNQNRLAWIHAEIG